MTACQNKEKIVVQNNHNVNIYLLLL